MHTITTHTNQVLLTRMLSSQAGSRMVRIFIPLRKDMRGNVKESGGNHMVGYVEQVKAYLSEKE